MIKHLCSFHLNFVNFAIDCPSCTCSVVASIVRGVADCDFWPTVITLMLVYLAALAISVLALNAWKRVNCMLLWPLRGRNFKKRMERETHENSKKIMEAFSDNPQREMIDNLSWNFKKPFGLLLQLNRRHLFLLFQWWFLLGNHPFDLTKAGAT